MKLLRGGMLTTKDGWQRHFIENQIVSEPEIIEQLCELHFPVEVPESYDTATRTEIEMRPIAPIPVRTYPKAIKIPFDMLQPGVWLTHSFYKFSKGQIITDYGMIKKLIDGAVPVVLPGEPDLLECRACKSVYQTHEIKAEPSHFQGYPVAIRFWVDCNITHNHNYMSFTRGQIAIDPSLVKHLVDGGDKDKFEHLKPEQLCFYKCKKCKTSWVVAADTTVPAAS